MLATVTVSQPRFVLCLSLEWLSFAVMFPAEVKFKLLGGSLRRLCANHGWG